MAGISFGLCGDCAFKWSVETRYFASKNSKIDLLLIILIDFQQKRREVSRLYNHSYLLPLTSYLLPPLENIRRLFLNLLQLVLHVHDKALDLRVIGFGADGIDFPTDFLGHKVQLLTISFLEDIDEIA